MSIFSRGQEVTLEDFCRDFYEKNILGYAVSSVRVVESYSDVVRNLIIETDQNFSEVTLQQFTREMTLMYFELFSLAWLHKFKEKLGLAQTIFTKKYLQEKGDIDIWQDLMEYNQAIADSVTFGKTKENPTDRGYLAFIYSIRFNLYEEYYKKGYDRECVARLCNRLFAENAWKNNITATLLMFTLFKRLGFDKDFVPSEKTVLGIATVIKGLYNGSWQSFDKMKIKLS